MFEELNPGPTHDYLVQYVEQGAYHPLLLVGDKGTGKRFIGRLIHRYLNCTGTRLTDCRCSACQQDAGDFHQYNLEKNSWGVDDVREFLPLIGTPPLGSQHRVIVWDTAERLTPEGNDTFLKQVEDHPPYNVFIFTSAYPKDVMPALRSRCWTVYVPPLREAIKGVTMGELRECFGIPGVALEKNLAYREKALLFLEGFFEPNQLMSVMQFKDKELDLSLLLTWAKLMVWALLYRTSPTVELRLGKYRQQYSTAPFLVVFSKLNDLDQKMKSYGSLRYWNQFFQCVLEIQFALKKVFSTCLTGASAVKMNS